MATVVVQCNYPNGLILQLRESKEQVTVNGYQNATIVESGYGLTSGVDKDFWENWVSENKEYPVYTNGCISAQGSVKKATAEAQGNKGTKSGNEQVPKPTGDTV